jgi:hypothetical protein
MSNKNVASWSTIAVVLSLVGAHGAHAGPLRYDDGSIGGTSGIWDPQQEQVGFGDVLSLGFAFDFFGGTATSVQVNNLGTLDLLNGGTTLGSITIADLAADPGATIFGRAAAGNPLPALGGDPVTAGFRVQWTFTNSLQAQLALFALGSGGSLIEFNYLVEGVTGLDLSTSTPALGVVTAAGTERFNLGSYLQASQPACLTTFGRGTLVADPAAPTDGCTSYFFGAVTSVALPPPFDTTNGGTAGVDDALADYRYLSRYEATTTPTPVPEPTTLTLLMAGFAALAASRRKRRDN